MTKKGTLGDNLSAAQWEILRVLDMLGWISDRDVTASDRWLENELQGPVVRLYRSYPPVRFYPSHHIYDLAAKGFIVHKTRTLIFGGWTLTEKGKQAVRDRYPPHVVRIGGQPSEGVTLYVESPREAAEALLERTITKPQSVPPEYVRLSSVLEPGTIITVESSGRQVSFSWDGSKLVSAEKRG